MARRRVNGAQERHCGPICDVWKGFVVVWMGLLVLKMTFNEDLPGAVVILQSRYILCISRIFVEWEEKKMFLVVQCFINKEFECKVVM